MLKKIMSKYAPAMALALSLNGVLFPGQTRADEPQGPAATQAESATQDNGVLTPAKLETMLRNLGYEPKDVSGNDTHNMLQIVREANGWKIFITVSLSMDGANLWFDCKFNPLADVSGAPAVAWAKLIELSRTYNPAFFTLDKTGRIHVCETHDNFRMTPAGLRQKLDDFDSVVRKSEPHWRADNFTPAPKLETLTDAGRKALDRLAGVWLVVGEQRNGVNAAAADVQASAITYTFAGEKCRVAPKQQKEVEGFLRTVGGDGTLEVDFVFVDQRQVQKALIKVEGDTMTICVANPGTPRPTEFTAPSGFNGMMVTLKRQTPAAVISTREPAPTFEHLIRRNPFATP